MGAVPTLRHRLEVALIDLNRRSLLEESHGHQQARLAAAPQHGSFMAGQRSRTDADVCSRLQPGFREHRRSADKQLAELSQIERKLRTVEDGQVTRNTIGGEGGIPLGRVAEEK